ncbi:MAG: MlaD family protein [Desulfotalea sp.]
MKPKITKHTGISVVWILPLLAVAICGWLLYDKFANGDVNITLYFEDANGIEAGKTPILLKGIKIGTISIVKPDFDQKKIRVIAKVNREVAGHLGNDTLFWVVRPELSAASITGLETIFSGNYIDTRLGVSKDIVTEFKGLGSTPPLSSSSPGLHILLEADSLGSIQKGTGIYYRNIQIGSVQDFNLKGEAGVSVNVHIDKKYQHLVHKDSRFCKVSGISFEGKLPDVKLKIESLSALIKGGILLHTPTNFYNSPLANNGASYSIYEDFDAATYGLEMKLHLPSLNNITEGSTKLIYHGVEVGTVQKIHLSSAAKKITATVTIDPRAEMILRKGTKFWLVEAEVGLEGIKNISTLLGGSHISFMLDDKSTEFQDTFEMSPVAPPLVPLRRGKVYHLTSKNISFARQSPVYFKGIKVGEVVVSKLVKSGHSIATDIYIYEEHLTLLSEKSVFWQYSGIDVQADLSGINVNIGPLAKIVSGGLAFTSPDKVNKKKNKPPEEGQQFKVYSSHEMAVENVVDLQKPGKRIKVNIKGNNSLKVGSPILRGNLTIGEIKSFSFNKNNGDIIATCFIEKKYGKFVNSRTKFFDFSGVQVTGNLRGIDLKTGSLQSMVNGGIGCFNSTKGRRKTPSKPYQLYKSFDDAVKEMARLVIEFSDLGGLQKSAPVMYKGIEIGMVSKLILGNDLKTTSAEIMVESKVLPLFREDTILWLTQPQISLQNVENLDAILLGPSISLLPGKGKMVRSLKGASKKPDSFRKTGFLLNLKAKRLNSLVPGSPVYYKQVPVGEVVSYSLDAGSGYEDVNVEINIKNKYKKLLNNDTKFWISTGLTIEAGLFSGIDIRTESLEAFLIGGISFGNPKSKRNKKAAVLAKSGQSFVLHATPEDSWLK